MTDIIVKPDHPFLAHLCENLVERLEAEGYEVEFERPEERRGNVFNNLPTHIPEIIIGLSMVVFSKEYEKVRTMLKYWRDWVVSKPGPRRKVIARIIVLNEAGEQVDELIVAPKVKPEEREGR